MLQDFGVCRKGMIPESWDIQISQPKSLNKLSSTRMQIICLCDTCSPGASCKHTSGPSPTGRDPRRKAQFVEWRPGIRWTRNKTAQPRSRGHCKSQAGEHTHGDPWGGAGYLQGWPKREGCWKPSRGFMSLRDLNFSWLNIMNIFYLLDIQHHLALFLTLCLPSIFGGQSVPQS